MIDTHLRGTFQPVFNSITRYLMRIGITPNQVTYAAFTVGMAAVPLILVGWLPVAVAVMWFSGLLDVLDGTLARHTGQASAWGTTLDIVFDRLVEIGIIMALAARFPASLWPMLWLMGSIVFSITVFLTVGALSAKKGTKSFYYQAGLLERTEGFILFTLVLLLPAYLIPLTWIFAALETFTGLQRFREAHRLFQEAVTTHEEGA